MSDQDKRKEALLLAGKLDGEKLTVEAEFVSGVTVTNQVGERSFLPLPFLDLLLLRQRGRHG